MDPKTQLSGLDPKLKEAYERVMGTTIPAQQPLTQEQSTPPPVVTPLQSPEPASLPQQPEPPPIQAEPSPSPVQSAEPPPKPDSHIATGFVANAANKEKRGGLKLSPQILMAVGVVFLILYIFFWMRVFNLSLLF